jgi:energy-coupling factor transporter transmembrane protein EcfT
MKHLTCIILLAFALTITARPVKRAKVIKKKLEPVLRIKVPERCERYAKIEQETLA